MMKRDSRILASALMKTGTGLSSNGDSNKKKRTNKVVIMFLFFILIPVMFAFGFLAFYLTMLRPCEEVQESVFKAVYDNSYEIQAKERYICEKIMNGISPEKIKKAYLEYENLIEQKVKEYYSKKQNSSDVLLKLRSCSKTEIETMIHALKNSSDNNDIRVFSQMKEAMM